jgi:hypothetical protein
MHGFLTRNIPAWFTTKQALRALYGRMKSDIMSRKNRVLRHDTARKMLKEHAENINLYVSVQTGRF